MLPCSPSTIERIDKVVCAEIRLDTCATPKYHESRTKTIAMAHPWPRFTRAFKKRRHIPTSRPKSSPRGRSKASPMASKVRRGGHSDLDDDLCCTLRGTQLRRSRTDRVVELGQTSSGPPNSASSPTPEPEARTRVRIPAQASLVTRTSVDIRSKRQNETRTRPHYLDRLCTNLTSFFLILPRCEAPHFLLRTSCLRLEC